jgi:chromosome condensin MukBEF MukE localization factor
MSAKPRGVLSVDLGVRVSLRRIRCLGAIVALQARSGNWQIDGFLFFFFFNLVMVVVRETRLKEQARKE